VLQHTAFALLLHGEITPEVQLEQGLQTVLAFELQGLSV
jgi:hypothetical protein